MTSTTRTRTATLVAAAACVLPTALLAAPAAAAPPANDLPAGATAITATPSTTTFDTTEATADAKDRRCVGDRSVWFRMLAPNDARLRMTTAGSSYNTLLAVFEGRRGPRELVDCDGNGGPGRTSSTRLRMQEGQSYWIAVSSEGDSGAGGVAVLTLGELGTAALDVVVEGATSGGVSGRLVVHGSMTCATPSEVRIYGEASQRVGVGVARGWSGRSRLCGSDPVGWRMRFDSDTGWAFQPGPASVSLQARLWDGITSLRQNLGTTVVTAVDDPDGRLAP